MSKDVSSIQKLSYSWQQLSQQFQEKGNLKGVHYSHVSGRLERGWRGRFAKIISFIGKSRLFNWATHWKGKKLKKQTIESATKHTLDRDLELLRAANTPKSFIDRIRQDCSVAEYLTKSFHFSVENLDTLKSTLGLGENTRKELNEDLQNELLESDDLLISDRLISLQLAMQEDGCDLELIAGQVEELSRTIPENSKHFKAVFNLKVQIATIQSLEAIGSDQDTIPLGELEILLQKLMFAQFEAENALAKDPESAHVAIKAYETAYKAALAHKASYMADKIDSESWTQLEQNYLTVMNKHKEAVGNARLRLADTQNVDSIALDDGLSDDDTPTNRGQVRGAMLRQYRDLQVGASAVEASRPLSQKELMHLFERHEDLFRRVIQETAIPRALIGERDEEAVKLELLSNLSSAREVLLPYWDSLRPRTLYSLQHEEICSVLALRAVEDESPYSLEDLQQIAVTPPATFSSSRKKLEAGSGLRNLGNTCYMNSAMQFMRAMPTLREDAALRSDSELARRFVSVQNKMQAGQIPTEGEMRNLFRAAFRQGWYVHYTNLLEQTVARHDALGYDSDLIEHFRNTLSGIPMGAIPENLSDRDRSILTMIETQGFDVQQDGSEFVRFMAQRLTGYLPARFKKTLTKLDGTVSLTTSKEREISNRIPSLKNVQAALEWLHTTPGASEMHDDDLRADLEIRERFFSIEALLAIRAFRKGDKNIRSIEPLSPALLLEETLSQYADTGERTKSKFSEAAPFFVQNFTRHENTRQSAQTEGHTKILTSVDINEAIELEGGERYLASAVILHGGSMNGGHYTCLIRHRDGEWYLYNDSRVSKYTGDIREAGRMATTILWSNVDLTDQA